MATDYDADDEEYESQGGKAGIIFLIDSRSTMFTKDYEDDEGLEQTRFNIALKCCRSVLMNKITAKQRDLVGVVLFGTDKSDPETNTRHVSLLLELNYPGAPAVKQLDKLLKDVNSLEIQGTYGTSNDFSLADALWFCSSLLSRSQHRLDEKKILLFTDDCNPHGNNVDQAHMARKRAKNLNEVQIALEILPLGAEFNYSAFYKELVETVCGHPDHEDFDPSTSYRLEQLLERVNRLEYKRRRYAKIKWDLGKDVSLGVSLYTFYREATALPTDTLSRRTNEPVKRVTQIYEKSNGHPAQRDQDVAANSFKSCFKLSNGHPAQRDQDVAANSFKSCFKLATGKLVLPSEIVNILSHGGEEIVFTNEEKEALKKIMEPGLRLLGFKAASVVKESIHCGQPSFVFPEETLIKGSRELMKALVNRCIAKKKVAVCVMTARYRALTKYFYLVPSEETYNSNGCQLSPCGFHAIPIAFDNDTREKKMNFDIDEIFSPCWDAARNVVNKLRMTYKPSDFKNPKLQQFWEHVEALALEYDALKVVEDSTAPDLLAQTDRLEEWNDQFIDNFELEDQPTHTLKRKNKPSTSASKRPRNEDIDVIKDIGEAIKTRKVEKFTVPQLKEFLSFHKHKVSNMKKAELVEAVYNLKR